MKQAPMLFRVDRLELSFKPKPWAFAVERRAEIDANFAKRRRENPALWNGRVLLLYRQVVQDGLLRGDFLETDYASFSAWTAMGRPPAGVHDCFGAAAVVGDDGASAARRHGAAHRQCRADLFSLRHARSRTTSWARRSISTSACGAS